MFTAKSLTLIIERRECKCGHSFTSPALEPRVTVENHRGEHSTISIQEYTEIVTQERKLKFFGLDRLPRELRHATVIVNACEQCFPENDVTTQYKRETLNEYRTLWEFSLQRDSRGNLTNDPNVLRREELYRGEQKRKEGSGQHKKNSRSIRERKTPVKPITMEDFK